ncbi:MAG: hypothetical protein JO297_06885 [Nitrososphaeraceae archaeon]|nr:hypothetical protein [Nitrososphaeraceae archaeon]
MRSPTSPHSVTCEELRSSPIVDFTVYRNALLLFFLSYLHRSSDISILNNANEDKDIDIERGYV